uniref:Uncharacterized protein n=1 Tax=Arundo donax TaxID=35708 RepID=A0A0A9A131_ARUDO
MKKKLQYYLPISGEEPFNW